MNKINLKYWIIISILALSSFTFGQELLLSGKITDKKSGEPIYYATISVDYDKTIVATDFDGNYSIQVALNDTIAVRYTGMKMQKIKVDTTLLNIELEEIEALNVEFGPPIRPIKLSNHAVTPVTLEDLQQDRKISGKIFFKENNEILAGTTIKNKRTGEITHSDVDGNFEIKASVNDVIELFYVGMSSHEIKVTHKSFYEIYLDLAVSKKNKTQKRKEKKIHKF